MGTFGVIPAVVLHEHAKNMGSPTVFAVYAALCVYANKEGWAFPSHVTMASELGISHDTVGRAIAKLEELGLILVKRPDSQGRGQHNRYHLVDKQSERGAPVRSLSQEGTQKVRMGAYGRGAPVRTEQYQGTREQRVAKKAEATDPLTGDSLGFIPT